MWGPMFQQQDRGLLGPLSMPGDRNGVFPPSRTESGWLGSQMHLPRGNLMELFNMVSGGGFSGSMISPGAFDRGGMAGVQGSAGFVAEGSGRAVADQVSGRSSQAQMETTQLRPEPQGCASQPAGDPAGGLGGQPGGSEAGGSAQGGANGQAGDQSGRGDSGQPSGSGVNQPWWCAVSAMVMVLEVFLVEAFLAGFLLEAVDQEVFRVVAVDQEIFRVVVYLAGFLEEVLVVHLVEEVPVVCRWVRFQLGSVG